MYYYPLNCMASDRISEDFAAVGGQDLEKVEFGLA